MRDTDFEKLIALANAGGGFIPANEAAQELLEQTGKGEIIQVTEATQRDIKFHRAYFSLMNFIYDYLPAHFHKLLDKKDFYKFVKHLKGEYKILYKFKDGTVMIEYDSIAFGKMSQKAFENYVREQLPYIYENIIAKYFDDPDLYNGVIDTIEAQYQNFLRQL